MFRRNFVAYFTSPLGYVFIWLFVLLSSLTAYYPPEFFNSNLANLDQLSEWFPFIMLVFVPSITMSMWADERRQGTDELLLTIPASDFDVVIGKYLAAVAIFSVALVFSMVTNLIMLVAMGSPDIGLFFATYFGYWLVGLAMVAIGMIGSFLTSNLTVAFVLGALLNAPLVLLAKAEWFMADAGRVAALKELSISGRFADFGRGALSVASMLYFLAVAFIMLYVSVVLLGRRHWRGGRDGHSMLGHYIARIVAVVVIGAGVVALANNHDLRPDATVEGLNSLSPDTIKLIKNLNVKELETLAARKAEQEKLIADLKKKYEASKNDPQVKKDLDKATDRLRRIEVDQRRLNSPIEIEAFISMSVPESYATKKLDLLAKLRELEELAGDKLVVRRYELEPFSKEAETAKEQYGIEARNVNTESRGVFSRDEIFLGALVKSGVNQVRIEFFELGIPVEYDLIRAISTVSQIEKKTLGVVKTDADLFGGQIDFTNFRQSPEQPMVKELKKHFNVVNVNPSEKIIDPTNPDKQSFDVLLVVQPSSLGPAEMTNLVDAIRQGTPTAIFEDPLPFWMQEVPGTDQPKQQRNMPGMFAPPRQEPKGNLQELWHAIGAKLTSRVFNDPADAADFSRLMNSGAPESYVVWQRYNPYPRLRSMEHLTSEWVFVNETAPGAKDPFNPDDAVSRGMHELLMLFPGAVQKAGTNKFTPLVTTGDATGIIRVKDAMGAVQRRAFYELRDHEKNQRDTFVLAARIEGEIDAPKALDAASADKTKTGADGKSTTAPDKKKLHVILVSDIDMLHAQFFELQQNP
ncbi:MAG: Gldg family protein, partial [Pirellulales bacterium]